jgi:hypothetical protein
VRVEFVESAKDPGLAVAFQNEAEIEVVVASTAHGHDRSGTFAAGEEAMFSVEFTNVLAPGRYFPVATISRLGDGLDLLGRSAREMSIVVQGSAARGGLVDLPVKATIDRSPAASGRSLELH